MYAPSHTARDLDIGVESACIPKMTDEGVIDFHSLRVTYATWLAESGVHVAEVQRHASPNLTLSPYASKRDDRMVASVN